MKEKTKTNTLSVWIEKELANVFDRFQMSYLQPNQLKKGSVIVATGKLKIHEDRSDGDLYMMSLKKWQTFRIMKPKKRK